jgi:hypothetical protein
VATAATLYPDVCSPKHLTLWGLRLGDRAVEMLEPLLTPPAYASPPLPQQEVERLDVLEEGVTVEGCEMLSRYLTTNTFLKQLHLDFNPVGDMGVRPQP